MSQQPTEGEAEKYRFRVREERCESCLYRLPYEKRTRDAILEEVERNDSYVQCHGHDRAANVCCRGYWDAVEDRGGTPVQLAWRFWKGGMDVIEFVGPDDYPNPEEE